MERETKNLVGEKIKSARIVCHMTEGCDGENLLILEMESGKTFYIEGGYGGYSGKSCDEYYEYIEVKQSHDFEKG
jgi:hypothetical protein